MFEFNPEYGTYTFMADPKYVNAKIPPEQQLFVAIIKSAWKENDKEYFESELFELHCELLRLNSDVVYAGAMRKMMNK